MNTDYGTNSNKSKQEETEEKKERPKFEKMTTGEVKIKKRNKFLDAFIQEDIDNVKSYIVSDVLIPAIKNLVIDTVTNSLSMLLGDTRGRAGRSGTSNVNYRSMYRQESTSRPRDMRGRGFDLNIVFSSRADAEGVLSVMGDILDQYGAVRVTDFYDLAGVTGDYTGNKYGWTNLNTAEVIRDRGEYLIRLPRPVLIDR